MDICVCVWSLLYVVPTKMCLCVYIYTNQAHWCRGIWVVARCRGWGSKTNDWIFFISFNKLNFFQKSLSKSPMGLHLSIWRQELSVCWKSDSQYSDVSYLEIQLSVFTSVQLADDDGKKMWLWSRRRHSSLIPAKNRRITVTRTHRKVDINRSK